MIFRFSTLFLYGFLYLLPAYGEEVRLHGDYWCPYNCEPNSEREGYLVDIAREVFEPQGYKVSYSLTPWARSLAMTQRRENSASLGAYFSDNPELIFPRTPIGHSKNVFVVSKNSNWSYKNLTSLNGVKLAAVQGYSYGRELDHYFSNNPTQVFWLQGDDPHKYVFAMLEAGHIDVFIEDMNVINHALRTHNQIDKFKIVGAQEGDAIHIAFSPAGKNGKVHAHLLSEGIIQLRQSGRLQKILKRYNLVDWE